MLKNVVLPAPFGPISEIDLAARHGEVDVVDGDETAELLPHVRRDEDVAVVVAPLRSFRRRPVVVVRDVVERLVVDALVELGGDGVSTGSGLPAGRASRAG